MRHDPYQLDQTDFAKTIQEIKDNFLADELPNKPPHPLRENAHIAALCDHLEHTKDELFQMRRPDGGMGDDAYFQFNEGLQLRPEVAAKVILDYLKQHPEITLE